jgi:hypothetical protein
MKTPGAHLFSAAKAMPREQGSMATCGVECGDIGSGWKAMVGATRPMCAWRVASLNRARMAVRRGGGGGRRVPLRMDQRALAGLVVRAQ